jgi:hypothetical protein
MKKRKKIIALAGLLVIGSLAIAGNYSGWFDDAGGADNNQPDAKEEYRRLYDRYTRTDSIMAMKGSITLYDGENPSAVKEQANFEYAKRGAEFYSHLSSLQTYCDGKLVLQLDTINKVIALSPANVESMTGDQNTSSLNMFFSDTAFRFTGSVSGNDHERTLTCRHERAPDIRLFRIIYDPVSYQLRKAEIEWWKDPLTIDTTRTKNVWIAKINYQHISAAPWKADELMNKIIKITKTGIEPTSRYKDYTIHDLTSEQKALFYEDTEQH